jgi:hypothetical protein
MMIRVCVLLGLAGSLLAQGSKRTSPEPGKEPSTVELTVYLVRGFMQPPQPVKEEVPQAVTDALQELREVFKYKSYGLIEVVTLRGRNLSGAEVAGVLPDRSHYDLKYVRVRISPETPRMLHLDGLHFEITRGHVARTETIALVSTDLDLRDGQKSVIGKSMVNGTDALFLVVVPKVID